MSFHAKVSCHQPSGALLVPARPPEMEGDVLGYDEFFMPADYGYLRISEDGKADEQQALG